jgi:hypothetical protein
MTLLTLEVEGRSADAYEHSTQHHIELLLHQAKFLLEPRVLFFLRSQFFKKLLFAQLFHLP